MKQPDLHNALIDMKKLLLPIVLSFFLAGFLPGFLAAHENQDHYNRISFSVSAEADAANDQLVVIMSIIKKGKNLKTLADEVNKTMAWALKTADKTDNIKAQTQGYQTNPDYTKGKQTGWQVSQSLSLKSTDIETLSDLLGKLQTQLQIKSVSYQVTEENRRLIKERLTTQALERFTQKASSIVQALRRKNYKIVSINISSDRAGHPRPMAVMARGMMASESVAAPSFEPGTQKISVSASGTIEILE